MAEYVRIPAEIVERDILKLPADLPYEVGALVEPVGCCVRALDRSNIQRGDTVVVIGAGFNGIVMALLAPHWGAQRVVVLDRLPVRIARAQALGLTVFNVDDADIKDQVKSWARGLGPHAVLVTPSAQAAVDLGFDLAGPGATVMLYAPWQPDKTWPMNMFKLLFNEITVTGTYSASPHDTRRALALLSGGQLDPNVLITHRFPLAEADKAWHMTKAAQDSLKVIVEIA
jgi:L-iditol 2-dehydrogenase